MLNSSVLDVAIGVVMAFLALSLMTSAVVEGINSILKLRASGLWAGIMQLVNDPGFSGLAKELYSHAAINPRGLAVSAANTKSNPLKNIPAYIDKQQFATALLDITGLSAASASAAAQPPGLPAITALLQGLNGTLPDQQNPQIRALLQGIVQRSQGDIQLIQKEVADWFDSAMDRVGGSFKRWTQLASVVIALCLAMLLNVDVLELGHRLWQHPTVIDQLKVPDSIMPGITGPAPDLTDKASRQARRVGATEAIEFLDKSLPIGWAPGQLFKLPGTAADDAPAVYWWNTGRRWTLPLGCLLTAFATLFGAPFWFDALQGLVRLKGTGPSPSEKAQGRAASA